MPVWFFLVLWTVVGLTCGAIAAAKDRSALGWTGML